MSESQLVEYKESWRDEYLKWICASFACQKSFSKTRSGLRCFANAQGGVLYIGKRDDGSVCGIEKFDESLKKIADIIENQILPESSSFVELGTKYIENKHIIEIKVRKGESLYYIKKYGRSSQGCYVRVGPTCRSMTEEQINTVHNKYLDAKVKITEIPSCLNNPTFQYLKLLLVEKGF